jgi:hypothetical protein
MRILIRIRQGGSDSPGREIFTFKSPDKQALAGRG